MLMLASFLVTTAIACLALNAFTHARFMGWVGPLAILPASLMASVFLAGGLAGAIYGPTENPEALNERAHALQVSGMYLQAERAAIGAPGAGPYRKGAIAEDLACTRAEDWLGAAMDIDLR